MATPDEQLIWLSKTDRVSVLADEQVAFQATLLEQITEGVIMTDLLGKIIYWNEGAHALFGYTTEEILGKTPALFYPDLDARVLESDSAALRTGQDSRRKWRGQRKDGTLIWVDTQTTLLRNSKGEAIGFISIATDITDHQQVGEPLQLHKTNMEMAFENVPSGIYLYDHLGHILLANALGARLLGFASVEEVLQEHNLAQMRQRFYAHYTVENEDSTPFHPEQGPVGRALHEQRDIQLITRYIHKKSQQHFWALCRATPVFDEQGHLTYLIYSITDITQQKEAEERIRELEQRKENFISMASHELKTPLTTVIAYTDILQSLFEKEDRTEASRYLSKMEFQIMKLSKLVADLLDVSKMQANTILFAEEVFDLDQFVREVVEHMQHTTPQHQIMIKGTTNREFVGDKDRLGQVLINLLTNAIKFSPHAEKVIVSITQTKEELIVSVQDFGIGIPKEHQEKIFERFYRISSGKGKNYPGLGIGLYLSHEIIRRHGGKLWVESIEGKGSVFSFALPLVVAEEA